MIGTSDVDQLLSQAYPLNAPWMCMYVLYCTVHAGILCSGRKTVIPLSMYPLVAVCCEVVFLPSRDPEIRFGLLV